MFSRINRYADRKLGRTLVTRLFVFVAVLASSGFRVHAGMVSFDGTLPRDSSLITDVNLFLTPGFGVAYSLYSGQSFGCYAGSVAVESVASALAPVGISPFEFGQTDLEPFHASSGCDTPPTTSSSSGSSHAAESAVKCHFTELTSPSPIAWLQRIKLLATPSGLPIELLRPPKMDLSQSLMTS